MDYAPATHSELLEAFRRLNWQRFEEFLLDLFAQKDFIRIERNVTLSGAELDFGAIEELAPGQQVRWAFDVKVRRDRLSVDDVDRAAGIRAQALRAGYSHFVLATNGPLTAAAKEKAGRLGIEVWDSLRLLQLSPPGLVESYLGLQNAGIPKPDHLTDKAAALAQSFDNTTSGNDAWPEYQRLIGDIVEFLFCPPLETPMGEVSDAAARNRRDFILENGAADGFWARVRTVYDAHYVVVDAKNYKSPLGKGPIIDVAHYLKPHGCGMFSLVFSRAGAGGGADHAVREQWIAGRKMILVLSDADTKEMLRLKAEAGDPEELLRKKIAKFRMSL
jgi:hypothetical protein